MKDLQRLVEKIDLEGFYPKEEIKNLAKTGYFEVLKNRETLSDAISNISKISMICGTTGFCMWCQFALIWYVLNSSNEGLKSRILPKLYSGQILGGTALSNPYKAFSGIEKNFLKAKKVSGGYVINGTLPWVSNISEHSAFGAIALLEDDEPIMGVVFADDKHVRLSSHIKYSSLEGSATKTIALKDYFLPNDDVLADKDIYKYLVSITPGFILLQAGIASGIIRASINEINKANMTHKAINEFLPFSLEDIDYELNELLKEVSLACKNIRNAKAEDILRLRLKASKLTSKATSAAVLYCGANGYLKGANAARLQREGNFVLIVTPSIKHILKELENIKKGEGILDRFKRKIV